VLLTDQLLALFLKAAAQQLRLEQLGHVRRRQDVEDLQPGTDVIAGAEDATHRLTDLDAIGSTHAPSPESARACGDRFAIGRRDWSSPNPCPRLADCKPAATLGGRLRIGRHVPQRLDLVQHAPSTGQKDVPLPALPVALVELAGGIVLVEVAD